MSWARDNAAPGRRVWQKIEADDPPTRRDDYPDLLAMAEAMLDSRRRRFPKMVERGQLDSAEAAAQLALFEQIAADWRWIVTGEGDHAPHETLPERRAALDDSLCTIAEIAREQRGFSTDLADQAECVIAMRWHLEPGRQTLRIAALTHAWRRDAALLRQQRETTCDAK